MQALKSLKPSKASKEEFERAKIERDSQRLLKLKARVDEFYEKQKEDSDSDDVYQIPPKRV